MRYLVGAFFSLLLLGAGVRDEAPISADSHAQLLYKYLKDEPDAKYLRAFTYYNSKSATKRVKSMRFWINQLHLEPAVSFAKEVPGSKGLLYVIDIREFGWSAESFSAIARREPYCVEPEIDSATAILLRALIGVEQDKKSLHVEAMVRADWFFRETFESDRSPSYYDALFAKFRFGKKKTEKKWDKRTDINGTTYYVEVEATTQTVQANFPKDEKDFERVFGVDKFNEFLKEFKIDTRHGAVVEGQEKGVSIVARQNRLVVRIITPTGSYYKTFDVKETSGKRDFVETLNKDFEFDAGEILTDTPCGGLACLLVDNVGKIVEVADNRFATDTSDLKYDARVRTPGSCFICHEQKYIKAQNFVEDMVKSGIDILFKKKKDAIAAKAFFLDWQDKLEHEQTLFTKFIAKTSGFKPGENASNLKAWRDEYDAPVGLTTAAIELGVNEYDFKLIAIDSTRARILSLIKGFSMPRKTWEKDGYREMILLKNASKK